MRNSLKKSSVGNIQVRRREPDAIGCQVTGWSSEESRMPPCTRKENKRQVPRKEKPSWEKSRETEFKTEVKDDFVVGEKKKMCDANWLTGKHTNIQYTHD